MSSTGAKGGEVAVIGLGKSGRSVATLLARHGHQVYASDAGGAPEIEKAAEALRTEGIAVDTGHHDLERIAAASMVVASPGVPPAAAPLAAARDAGVPIVGEIEIALRHLTSTRAIAVTGTNGKTTTTSMIGHLLRALGVDAVDAGNIGVPLAEVALRPSPPAWIALELSSFQLHDTPGVKPAVGVVTNLGPDHLDRYAGVAEYYADKALLFSNASEESVWVLNADQPDVMSLYRRSPALARADRLPGATHTFSLEKQADAWFDRAADTLVVLGEPLMGRADLALFGDHNVANALSAALAVMVADPAHRTPEARAAIAEGLRSFRALQHRLEVVGEFDGVLWINDSKATNVGSTLVAVQGMTRPTILLLGGRHKGEPYTALAEPLSRVGKRVLAYGEAAALVERDLATLVPTERVANSFEAVIDRARAIAAPGDVVLLSPACSSYDMFDNYEQRGAEFRRLASAPARAGGGGGS